MLPEQKAELKTCHLCQIPKPLSKFYKDRSREDGHCVRCSACVKQASAQWKKENLVRFRENKKAWRLANPEKVKQGARENRQKNDYGLLPGEAETIIQFQKNCCAICQKPLALAGENRRAIANIDHSHLTGEVRGILCWSCNAALGKFRDNPILFQRAAEYLIHYPAILALGSRRFGLPGRISTSRKNRRAQARDVLTVGLVPLTAYQICAPEIRPADEVKTKRQQKLLDKTTILMYYPHS